MVSSPLDRSGAAESERGDTRQKQILLRFFVATRPQGFQTEPQRGKIDGGISGRGVGYLIDEARARPPGDSVLGPARGRILWKAGRPSYKPSAGGGRGGIPRKLSGRSGPGGRLGVFAGTGFGAWLQGTGGSG